ncbi:hypothetical protein GCM10023198_18610 [Promicromonospora umidemergens]|uniref:Uncharacterized protein n=1 Tax=Promicromonospora umidemergens TaxID=629679 RepID=A0ABP8X000_9MICO
MRTSAGSAGRITGAAGASGVVTATHYGRALALRPVGAPDGHIRRLRRTKRTANRNVSKRTYRHTLANRAKVLPSDGMRGELGAWHPHA